MGRKEPFSRLLAQQRFDGLIQPPKTRALQQAFWSAAKDIGQPQVRQAIADAAGFDGAALLKRQADDDVRAKWAADRDHAVETGVFGFPTFLYDSEIYWGQDNLPFLERHVSGDRP